MVDLFGVLHWSSLANLIRFKVISQKLVLRACFEVILKTLALFFSKQTNVPRL